MAAAVSTSSRLPIVLDAAVDVLVRMSGTTVAAVYLAGDDGRYALSAVRAKGWRPPQSIPRMHQRVARADVDGHECALSALTSDGVTVGVRDRRQAAPNPGHLCGIFPM